LVFPQCSGLGFGADRLMPYLTVATSSEIVWRRLRLIFGAFAFGAVFGPYLMGWVFDTTGSYQLACLSSSLLQPGCRAMLPLGVEKGSGVGKE